MHVVMVNIRTYVCTACHTQVVCPRRCHVTFVIHIFCIEHIDADDAVVNPKVNNMLQCYDSVKYDLLWISDANILGQSTTSQTSVECFV